MSVRSSRAFLVAEAIAVARPIPLAAPVIRTRLFSTVFGGIYERTARCSSRARRGGGPAGTRSGCTPRALRVIASIS